jgi:Cys-tRNA(Pro) deacylase
MRVTPQEQVQAALRQLGLPGEVVQFKASTRTASDAASAVGCALGQIVKTLFFLADGRPTIALVAGDRQADTARLAELLGIGRKKLKMGTPDEVMEHTGYPVGGVAPVGWLKPCDVVVDESLKRFDVVWAAAGNGNAVFEARTADLVRAINGQWAAITREEA